MYVLYSVHVGKVDGSTSTYRPSEVQTEPSVVRGNDGLTG